MKYAHLSNGPLLRRLLRPFPASCLQARQTRPIPAFVFLTNLRAGIEIKQADSFYLHSEASMKSLFLAVCIVCLAASRAVEATSHRAAECILKEYNEIKLPALDSSKRNDSASLRNYVQERAEAVEKQNALAEELYRSH